MALASYSALYQALLNNVVEIRFGRRRRLAGLPPIRRMLCTNNAPLLNSVNGKVTLNYRAPSHPLKYDPASQNLIITCDILMQDFRNISLESCEIVKTYAPNEEFWSYFNSNIYIMSQQEKITFMMS